MKSTKSRIYALSENSLTLQLDPVISEKQIRFLYQLQSTILKQKWPAVYEVVVTFHELSVFFDFNSIPYEEMEKKILDLYEEKQTNQEYETQGVNRFLLPVCYEEEFALDKDRLQNHTGLPFSEIVSLHHQGNYLLYMIGFLPGFMYLGGLDERINCPRLENPREKVSAGSVGIAGQQSGIYPMDSPGGWNIIGRTPLTLFDYEWSSRANTEDDYLTIHPLDQIRFIPVSKSGFEELQGMNILEYQSILPGHHSI